MTPEILLKGYVDYEADDAFRELVHCTLDGTFSAAVRMTGGVTVLAEQVCERVYSELALAAADWPESALVMPWLHERVVRVASRVLKEAERSVPRKHAPLVIESVIDCTPERLMWLLADFDAALRRLEPARRDLLILRYLERRGIGTDIFTSNEGVLRVQVLEAVEQLSRALRRFRITITPPALAFALETQLSHAAPPGLERRVTQGALFAAAATPGFFELFRPRWVKLVHLRIAAGCAVGLLLLWLHPAFHHRTHYVLQSRNETLPISDYGQLATAGDKDGGYVPVPELARDPEPDPVDSSP